jgi:hypothetical protein
MVAAAGAARRFPNRLGEHPILLLDSLAQNVLRGNGARRSRLHA